MRHDRTGDCMPDEITRAGARERGMHRFGCDDDVFDPVVADLGPFNTCTLARGRGDRIVLTAVTAAAIASEPTVPAWIVPVSIVPISIAPISMAPDVSALDPVARNFIGPGSVVSNPAGPDPTLGASTMRASIQRALIAAPVAADPNPPDRTRPACKEIPSACRTAFGRRPRLGRRMRAAGQGVRLAVLLALVLTGGCATTPRATLYQQLGERPGIDALVETLLERVADDPRIAHRFAHANIVRLHDKLGEQICMLADGPCAYSGASMIDAHAGRQLTDADFNALVEDLIAAMQARKVPRRAQNQLLRRLAALHGEVVYR